MLAKDEAKKIIETLPDAATFDDIMDALYIKTKFEKSKQAIEDGQWVSHEEAKERLSKWLRSSGANTHSKM